MTDKITKTPKPEGGNLSRIVRDLGLETRDLIKTYTTQVRQHERVTEELERTTADIHATILEVGRRLIAAKEMYPNTRDYDAWCKRYVNQPPFNNRQERAATKQITELHDFGADPLDLDQEIDDADWEKLDLTGCPRITPTNIMSWARETQRHLFPELRKQDARNDMEAKRRQAEKDRRKGRSKERHMPEDDELILAHDANAIGSVEDLARRFMALTEREFMAFLDCLMKAEGGPEKVRRLYAAMDTVLHHELEEGEGEP
jgi:hypothetical protein